MTGVKKLTIVFMAAIVALVAFISSASAAAPAPNYGSGITVDGNTNDWTLGTDYFADMIRAGGLGGQTTVESKLYLRYDCTNEVMYALVLVEPGVQALTQADDAWIAIDGNNNKVTFTRFEWVYDANDVPIGYEASFSLPLKDQTARTGSYYLLAHIQVFDDGESQTSATDRTNKDGIPLEISCPITPPPPEDEWMGCTPGYWKNHPEAWVGHSTTDTLGSVFGLQPNQFTTVSPSNTLMDALNYRGGSGTEGAAQILLRAASAAVLNEAKFGNDYPPYATEQELINAVKSALTSKNRDVMIELAEKLDYRNNGNCG